MENTSPEHKYLKVVRAGSRRGMNTFLFFTLLFVYQIICIFQGVDMCDSGSYASFYQQIFKNPESVQYNFMFWLSGIIGGLYIRIFPFLGLWGIRLAGVIISTLTILFAYKLLKPYLDKGRLQLSLVILTLFINNNPKEFYYNNLSAFIYILVAYFLFHGVRRSRMIPILISGALVSLNVFNRLPNILGIGMIAGILFHGYLYQTGYKKQVKQCLFFILGFLACTAIVLAVMHIIGHLSLFIDSLRIVFSMGKSTKQVDGLESNYGIFNLIKLLYGQYKFSIIAAALFFVFVLIILPIVQQIKTKFPFTLVKVVFSKYLFMALMVFLILTGEINYIAVLYFFTGICLLSAVALFINNKSKEISLLMFLGIFIAVVHPVGSSTGIHTVIIYSFWLAFPLSVEYLFSLDRTRINISLSGKLAGFSMRLTLGESQLLQAKRVSVGIVIFACLFHSYYYPYFDKSNRLDMHYSIHNKYMKGIYTSKERADALNELLQASSRYVKPNDYVLAYDCIPLYHYLTETKPYLQNSWPWLYQPDVFRDELIKGRAGIKTLPVVIFQTVRTMGPNGGKWPDYSSGETTLNWDLNKSRNEVFLAFLSVNHYREVWSNRAFKILIPDESVSAVK